MRILYVASKYDYGKPEQGYSFAHYNFYDTLLNMGHEILYFDFQGLLQRHGKDWMNRRLVDAALAERPDLVFTVLSEDEITFNTLDTIRRETDTLTLNWFTDDHWRFDHYSRFWAPHFHWSVTTASSAVPKYAKMGYQNVIKSQWACNHFLYRRLDLPYRYDVTFVGQPHGNRREVIQAIRDAGIEVHVWGTGWESGRLTQEQMIETFNTSRINLNLSNASISFTRYGHLSKAVDNVRFGKQLKALAKPVTRVIKRLARLEREAAAPSDVHDQIKGRNFEIPGCAGFLLTGTADNLEDYYVDREEIACFQGTEDLIAQIRHFLAHEAECDRIRYAGYRRTLHEHTYAHRFSHIFHQMGLPVSALSLDAAPGSSADVS